MTVPKKYFHDRIILLIISINAFLAIAGILSVLFSLGGDHSSGYIVQYRANLGLSAFKSGNSTTFIGFMLFMVFTMAFNTILSVRAFHVRRGFALAVLGMATVLLLLSIIVSKALLFNIH